MKRILIADDDGKLRSRLVRILKGAGYDTDEASSGGEAAAKAAAGDYDLVLLDMVMPKGGGIEALMELRKVAPRTKVVMITAYATIEHTVDAMRRGASDYLSKPFKIDELLTTVRRVLEESRIDECGGSQDVDGLLCAFSNSIRTKIIRLLSSRTSMRLMEIARELSMADHTKAIFHLKILKEAGIVEQNGEKTYSLTKQGERTSACLKILEIHLAAEKSGSS